MQPLLRTNAWLRRVRRWLRGIMCRIPMRAGRLTLLRPQAALHSNPCFLAFPSVIKQQHSIHAANRLHVCGQSGATTRIPGANMGHDCTQKLQGRNPAHNRFRCRPTHVRSQGDLRSRRAHCGRCVLPDSAATLGAHYPSRHQPMPQERSVHQQCWTTTSQRRVTSCSPAVGQHPGRIPRAPRRRYECAPPPQSRTRAPTRGTYTRQRWTPHKGRD